MEGYIKNLNRVLENVPPAHIFNYDETNSMDDQSHKGLLFVAVVSTQKKSETRLGPIHQLCFAEAVEYVG